MKTFFCDPHSLWQRGSIENTNGLLCRELAHYSDQNILDIVWATNKTPRKCLGFLSPAEAFIHQLRRWT